MLIFANNAEKLPQNDYGILKKHKQVFNLFCLIKNIYKLTPSSKTKKNKFVQQDYLGTNSFSEKLTLGYKNKI